VAFAKGTLIEEVGGGGECCGNEGALGRRWRKKEGITAIDFELMIKPPENRTLLLLFRAANQKRVGVALGVTGADTGCRNRMTVSSSVLHNRDGNFVTHGDCNVISRVHHDTDVTDLFRRVKRNA
jgi:hypothetical protein